MQRRSLFWSLMGLVTLPAAARAHSYTKGSIALGHAWALPGEGEGKAFFPVVNTGSQADELVTAKSSVCTQIEFRRNDKYDDPPLASFVLEPGRPMAMRPTARHLRLMGLKTPLVLDQRFTILLGFRNAGEIEIEFHVEHTPGD
jgi:copper(I)-binding protein